MARKKKEDGKGGGAADWMTTYSDMMTILFVLFVLLFSMSSINPVKWDILVQTYGNRAKTVASVEGADAQSEFADAEAIIQFLDDLLSQFLDGDTEPEDEFSEQGQNAGADNAKYDFDDLYNFLSEYVEGEGLSDEILILKEDNQIMIRFKDKAFFASGSYLMTADGIALTKFIGKAITLALDDIDKIVIEGHTDNVPHPQYGNWWLAFSRANTVRMFFEEVGIPMDRHLVVPSILADTNPIASNDTPEGRSLNRRVEIKITRAIPEDGEMGVIIDDVPGGG